MPEGVVDLWRVADYIREHKTPMIKTEQLEELSTAIIEWQATVSEERILNHVENLRKRHASVNEGENPLCPYCGGEMVLRKSRKNGTSFYDCKAYPKCRGIVKVS